MRNENVGKEKWGVHEGHCCEKHGCKYGNEGCPVVNKLVKQRYICEWCSEDGIENLQQLNEELEFVKKVKDAEEKGETTIEIPIALLKRMQSVRWEE